MPDLFQSPEPVSQGGLALVSSNSGHNSKELKKQSKQAKSDLTSNSKSAEETTELAETNEQSSFLNIDLKAKEILPQINWIITQRKAEYLSDLLALSGHKSVAVKRKIAEGIGIIGSKDDADKVQIWLDSEADRETWLILQASKDKLSRKNSDNHVELEKLSVAEAIGLVKNIIGDKTYIIEGELTEVKPIKNMFAFGLKDKEARLNCWALASVSERKNIPMNEGLTVRLKGKFKLSKDSRLYFNVENIDLTGEGELLRNLKLLEERLKNEGLFDQERKRKIPILPKRILLLASSNSAAIQDFYKVLGERRGGLDIYHIPIKTQGIGAEMELLTGLEKANVMAEALQIDTIVITRGGGSNDDLAVFNSERVIRSIYGLNRPSIVAIGHERDITLSELAADLRASTPSNAAELVSLSSVEVLGVAKYSYQEISSLLQAKIISYSEVNKRLIDKIINIIRSDISSFKYNLQSFDAIIQTLIGEVKNLNTSIFQNIKNLVLFNFNQTKFAATGFTNLISVVQGDIEKINQQNVFITQNIKTEISCQLESFSSNLQLVYSEIQQYDVQAVLEKGFALILQDGKVVETKKALKKQSFTIKFQDGQVESS